jgi:hypothetical protein
LAAIAKFRKSKPCLLATLWLFDFRLLNFGLWSFRFLTPGLLAPDLRYNFQALRLNPLAGLL